MKNIETLEKEIFDIKALAFIPEHRRLSVALFIQSVCKHGFKDKPFRNLKIQEEYSMPKDTYKTYTMQQTYSSTKNKYDTDLIVKFNHENISKDLIVTFENKEHKNILNT